jgi:hypothetical protein
MTNTLHRRGTPESLKNDFVIFCLPARGVNAEGSAAKVKEFMRICLKYKPVNLGDGRHGNALQERNRDLEAFLAQKKDGEMAAAVFTDMETLGKVISELIQADLGISINVSGLFEEVRACCRKGGIERHSVEHSLGFWGAKDRLPEREILEVNTLCGHGMVSFNLIRKMVEYVRLRRLTPQKAAQIMARCCECGAFNPARGEHLLRKIVMKS